jgi:hypothetical protein
MVSIGDGGSVIMVAASVVEKKNAYKISKPVNLTGRDTSQVIWVDYGIEEMRFKVWASRATVNFSTEFLLSVSSSSNSAFEECPLLGCYAVWPL